MNKKVLYVIKEILEETKLGLIQKGEKYYPRKSNLSNEAYEKIPILYNARPIPYNKIKK